MTYENLRLEMHGAVATVVIAREKALNALNRQTLTELRAVLAELDADQAVRAIVLTGAGDKAFVAGADISEMREMGPAEARAFAMVGHSVGHALERLSKPVIAAVNGFALGGGCELALACDFIYASQKAKFGQPEVNLGVMAGFGGTQRLARRIGTAYALELLVTGDMIGADEALRVGLVNKVCAPEALLAEARVCGDKIAQRGPLAVAATKRAVRRGEDLSLSAANELEQELFAHLFSSSDQKEGMRAFLEKRAAQFEGK